jgi:hypothetical protein
MQKQVGKLSNLKFKKEVKTSIYGLGKRRLQAFLELKK